MITAILTLFFGLSNAEQSYVSSLACGATPPTVVDYRAGSTGTSITFKDGSTLSTFGSETKILYSFGILQFQSKPVK